MKQDYLWDKKGSDVEIERLEELLSGFRYVEESKAESNILEFPVRSSNNGNSHWILAMAACVGMGAIAIGAWTLLPDLEAPLIAEVPRVATDTAAPLTPPVPATVVTAAIPTDTEAAASDRPVRIRKYTQNTSVPTRRIVRKGGGHQTITKDEKLAYDQLMLALSITSSKLQIVRDSVNATQESEVNNK